MHELTLATNLVELACRHADEHGAERIARITIRLGVLSGIARSLYFCFKPAARGTSCEHAVLQIVEVPLTVHCGHCNATKHPRALYNFRCPSCGHPTPKVLTGREMQLVSIELAPGEADRSTALAAGRSPMTEMPGTKGAVR